jgi:hypothetical protein
VGDAERGQEQLKTSPALSTLIRARAMARRERERKQRELISDDEIFKDTIESKLTGLCHLTQFENFTRCGREEFYRICKCCGNVETMTYRCSLKWCPQCSWKLSEKKKNLLGLWVTRVKQPKHLVLTQQNFPVLTAKKIREHTRNLAAMRRTKCFKSVRGGCVSVEITRGETGWHLHSHWLIDCPWLDMSSISTTWGKLVGQEFAIVKVKDVRDKAYLQEVTKYVVEGSELAKWPAESINEFVHAIRGRRFFFVFGSLFHESPDIRRELRAQKKPAEACECGESSWTFQSEAQAQVEEIMRLNSRPGRTKPLKPSDTVLLAASLTMALPAEQSHLL